MAKQSKMVKPVEVTVEVKRRTTHGIVCACGSSDVSIERTKQVGSQYPAFINRGWRVVRRYCVCATCGTHWSQTHQITDQKLG